MNRGMTGHQPAPGPTPPSTVIGLPAYRNRAHLPEALESLLGQTRGDLRLIVVDDAADNNKTERIVGRYQARDARIDYLRNERRLGYIANARRAFHYARERWPEALFFAWASDHDVWHPRWLEVLARALEDNPAAVMAYPDNFRIDEEGAPIHEVRYRFDSRDIGDPRRRLSATFRRMTAGDMVYGLFRCDALERAGILRPHLLADRLLLAELSLYGPFVHVGEFVWYRRYAGLASLKRQRLASFPDRKPVHIHLPWWLAHSAALLHALALARHRALPMSRPAGAALAMRYAALSARHVAFRGLMVRARTGRKVLRKLARSGFKRARQGRRLGVLVLRRLRAMAYRLRAMAYRLRRHAANLLRRPPGSPSGMLDADAATPRDDSRAMPLNLDKRA